MMSACPGLPVEEFEPLHTPPRGPAEQELVIGAGAAETQQAPPDREPVTARPVDRHHGRVIQ